MLGALASAHTHRHRAQSGGAVLPLGASAGLGTPTQPTVGIWHHALPAQWPAQPHTASYRYFFRECVRKVLCIRVAGNGIQEGLHHLWGPLRTGGGADKVVESSAQLLPARVSGFPFARTII